MFDTLRKFWVALNSANSTKSLSLAIALGVIVGLTPTLSIHNFILFFIVLVFSIHVGLFLITTTVFSFVGYLFDPLFAKLGQGILTDTSLNEFFTALYNLPLMKLTNFNNTILMGSLVVALLVAPIVYLVSQKLFATYREVVMSKCSSLPVIGSFFYNQKKASKKQPLVRKSGIIAFVGFMTSIVLFVTLLFDPIVKYAITKTVEKSTGKGVSIDSLQSKFFEGSLSIKGFELIDRKQNIALASFDELHLQLRPELLFDKKVIIEDLSLHNLNLDQKAVALAAQEPKAKPKSDKPSKVKESLSNQGQNLKESVKMPTVEEVLAQADLQSVQRVEQIQKDMQQLQNRYEAFREDFSKEQLQKLQARVRDFQKDLQDMKDPQKVLAAKSKFDALQSDIKKYQTQYGDVHEQLRQSYNSIEKNISGIDKVAKQDIQNLKQKYGSAEGLFSMMSLFTTGDEEQTLQKIYNVYLKIKPYLQSDAPKKQTQEQVYYRDIGRFVIYKDNSPYSRVVIKNAKLNVSYQQNSFDGVLTNYATDQNKTQKPMLLVATGKNPRYEKLEMRFLHNQITQQEQTKLNLLVSKYRLDEFSSKQVVLHEGLADLSLESDIDLASDAIVSDIYLDFSDVSLSSTVSQHLSNALGAINSFDMLIAATIGPKDSQISIRSDASKKFAKLMATELLKSQSEYVKKLEDGLYDKLNLQDLQSDKTSLSSKLSTLADDKDGLSDLSSQLAKSFTQAQKGGAKEKVEGLMQKFF